MLDTFIIDRIRRDRERERNGGRLPLRIERRPPPPPPEESTRDDHQDDKRGSVIIDYRL